MVMKGVCLLKDKYLPTRRIGRECDSESYLSQQQPPHGGLLTSY